MRLYFVAALFSHLLVTSFALADYSAVLKKAIPRWDGTVNEKVSFDLNGQTVEGVRPYTAFVVGQQYPAQGVVDGQDESELMVKLDQMVSKTFCDPKYTPEGVLTVELSATERFKVGVIKAPEVTRVDYYYEDFVDGQKNHLGLNFAGVKCKR